MNTSTVTSGSSDNVATWTLTISDGTYEVAVTAEDALGNPTVDAAR